MNKHETIQRLTNGISEITYTDSHSVEQTLIGTLCCTHLPDDILTECREFVNSDLESRMALSMFDVNAEKWTAVPWESLIDVEQLTGDGAPANEKKLQASSEYMEQMDLFPTDESDWEDGEHPEHA